eukprot:Anaeramoba_flamelloidesa87472_12.p3 GENE.a87472_12~~a87472_12.p3  ORF type:complete len:112 (-),score=6.92 a87472_12:617-952(-)
MHPVQHGTDPANIDEVALQRIQMTHEVDEFGIVGALAVFAIHPLETPVQPAIAQLNTTVVARPHQRRQQYPVLQQQAAALPLQGDLKQNGSPGALANANTGHRQLMFMPLQ